MWPHKTKPCPATDEIRHQGGTTVLFIKVCKSHQKSHSHTISQPHQNKCQCPNHTHPSTSIRQIQDKEECHQQPDSSFDEYTFTLKKMAYSKMLKVTVRINDIPSTMIVDTGASLDIINEMTFHKLNQKACIQLGCTSTEVFAYGSHHQLPLLGKLHLLLRLVAT